MSLDATLRTIMTRTAMVGECAIFLELWKQDRLDSGLILMGMWSLIAQMVVETYRIRI
jgi:hypothetical protein